MRISFVKCHRCKREYFPNQLTPVKAPVSGKEFKLCPDCTVVIDTLLGDKDRVEMMIRSTVPASELAGRYTKSIHIWGATR
jgi:hypothetical protein